MARRSTDLNRRRFLKGVGAAAAGAATAGACGDDGTNRSGDRGDVGPFDAEPADIAASPDGSPDAGAADAAGSGDTSSTPDAPGPAPALRPVRGDGSHPFHYIDTIVLLQMENRSFDHYFGALSLEEGRTDVDGLTAGIANPTRGGRAVPSILLTDEEAFLLHPDPGHGHGDCLAQFNEGRNDGFIRNWEPKLSEEEYERKLGWAMGYHNRPQLPAHYGLADAFTLCDHWFCSLLGPTWPNRFFSHAATSDGQWSNRNPLESPAIYRAALDAGLSVGCYHQSVIYFMLTVMNPSPREYMNGNMQRFFRDAEAGTLPNITIVEPDYTLNDDHPPQDIRLGQSFIASVYEALRRSPQWDRTLLVVFYDEHGGFHDHVPPPKVEGETRADEGFDQLGFRVPGLLAGPLVRRGHVMKTTVDHASVPALISEVFGLPHVNRRSELAGRFDDAFDVELTLDARRPAAPILPMIELDMERIERSFDFPFGQPELEDFARRVWGLEEPPKVGQLRRTESWLRDLDRLRVARVR